MKGESGEALTRRMDAAIGTADKVSNLIRQLLAFSRRQPVEPQVVDLNRVVGEVEALVERLLRDDVVLATDLEPGLDSVLVDPAQVEQILVNLVVNAQDAMPTGGRITLRTRNLEHDGPFLDLHPSAAPGPHVALVVADQGAGIPPELHDKIFDPFFTTKEEKGSSGLGLATVYGIVQQNGGFVTFESQVGSGTVFEVHLPACDQRPAPQARREIEPTVRTDPARVLLVEDNEPMRVATQEMLETLGHTVLVAADGERALHRLTDDDEPVGLLVTDVVMPGMSGKELLDRIREHHGPVPCLFISGYADQTLLHRGLEKERVDLLQKPFGLEEMARKIAEILG
jgi:CheY-like chemotaxis protein